MEQSQLFIIMLLAIQLWISVVTRKFFVLPDNSSCTFQPCATLSEYLLDNGTLPFVSNVQYYFLPGEHHIPANILLHDLHNFSIIGTVKESPTLVVLVGCLRPYVINVTNSYNFTIANVIFKRCDQTQLNKYKYLTNLLLNLCYSCTIENVIFMNLGLKGTNLIGNSYLTKIVIKSDVTQPYYLVFCGGITLYYYDKPMYEDHKHVLIMNEIIIKGDTRSKCYNTDPVGIHIAIGIMENLLMIINNSLFYSLDHTAIRMKNDCLGTNILIIENC